MSEETLFQEALSRAPEERAAFLKQACAGRPELLAAVLALLAVHERSGNILDRAPIEKAHTVGSGTGRADSNATLGETPGPDNVASAAAGTADYHPKSAAGIVIAGRYTLQEKIGEGGMGEVWVAKQTEPVKRRVALKLIKTGMDSMAVLARFEHERQALAMMDHPNIAKVLDGGLTPTGQPFFVMELVNGLPLAKFCDEVRLSPHDRLELFLPICQAVQHAHQKGIVHRDLKPANILITIIDGKPVPKVIDFGVAKAIAGKLTDVSMSTQFGSVIGTLEYMSPEQAGFSGVDIDTRADIYSLGVILYELLTGLRPIDARRLRNAALTEMIRIIREEEPSKPSTRLSTDESLPSLAALRQTAPRELMALLRGELDWVVMKCLEKHRERRYETANALARDIERYLADEVVEARPQSAGYRLSKFLRRNRGPVLAASLILLALVVGIVGTTYGLIRAEIRRVEAERARAGEAEQRLKAEKARDRTRQALDSMTSSVTGDSLATQQEISDEQKKFLAEVLTYYQEFAGEKADDEASRARTAEAAYRVGFIEGRLGRTTEAAAAWRKALDGYAKLVADSPAVPLFRQNLAASHMNLEILLAGLGNRLEAEEQHRKALAIQAKLVSDFPAVPLYRKNLATGGISLGNLLAGLGKWSEAEEQFRKALAIERKLAAEFPGTPEYRSDLARSLGNLGLLLAGLGKRPEAEEQYRNALAIDQKLADEFPAVPDYRYSLARSHDKLGILLAGLGDGPEAEEHYRNALAIREKLVSEFPTVPEYRVDLGGSYCNFGILVTNSGEPGESLAWFEKAIRILTVVYEQDRRLVEVKTFLRNSHWGRALAYDRLRNFTEAIKNWDKAIELSPIAEQPGFRASRAAMRLKAGQMAEAVAEVAELTKNGAGPAASLYDFACFYAIASGKSADKKQEYADRAMDLLQRAVKAGYSDAAHMAEDPDLDPIRGREDFKTMIEELVAKPG